MVLSRILHHFLNKSSHLIAFYSRPHLLVIPAQLMRLVLAKTRPVQWVILYQGLFFKDMWFVDCYMCVYISRVLSMTPVNEIVLHVMKV